MPLPDEVRTTEQSWLDGTSQPDIIFYDVSAMNTKKNGKKSNETTEGE